ncbi:unnamed protein product [Schistosoma turkestanicum]|nr:unnamed protein product [Schistosoma turkestanicum]
MYLTEVKTHWKDIFILSNIILIIFSATLIGLASRVLDVLSNYSMVLDIAAPVIFPIVIVTGILGILAVSVGIVGLWNTRNIFIISHIIGLTIATIIEVGISIKSSVSSDQFFTEMNRTLWNSLKYYCKHPMYENQIDNLYRVFQCCGVKASTDYGKESIPFSCKQGNIIYSKGCADVLTEYVYKYEMIVIYVCFAFAVFKAIYLVATTIINHQSDRNNASM